MPFLFAPPQQPVVPVQDEDSDFFPINRVFGIAKNYAEPGQEVTDKPFYFIKSPDCVVPVADGTVMTLEVPPGTQALKHEIELVACLGKGGRNMTLEEAESAVWGWCAGIDFTLGDAPDIAHGKAFERSAPVTHVRPAYRAPMPAPVELWLYVNSQKRQGGSTSNLIVKPYEIIAELSKFWELRPGDMIFTGTPAGASVLKPGDRIEAGVNGVGSLKVQIA